MMLAGRAASRRAALAILAGRQLPRQQSPLLRRPVSFLSRGKVEQPEAAPVYFPRQSTWQRSRTFRGKIVRVAVTTLVFYACWQIFAIVVLDPFLDFADSEWDTLSEKEKEEIDAMVENEPPPFFLPFPFTTKEVKQPPYKGSDPEWLMFLAVNKDEKLQKEIKVGLAEVIRRGVERSPAFVKLLGGKDVKVRKLWLDIIYPPVPPPKHYISGLIIDDDGIFWGDRPIDSLAANSLDVVLYPKAAALTAWTFVNVLVKQTAQDVGRALGITEAKPEATWQSVALNRMKEQAGAIGPTGKQATKVATEAGKQPTVSIPSGTADVLGFPLGGDLDPRIQTALQAAALTFSKNYQPAKQPPNRGCIRVDGLVELSGKSAVMAVYVLGWYDPKLKKFMGIQTGLKHLIQLKQRPAGG